MRTSPPADRSGLEGSGGADKSLVGEVTQLLPRRSFLRTSRQGGCLRLDRSSSDMDKEEGAAGLGLRETGVRRALGSAAKAESSIVNSDTCSKTPTRSELCMESKLVSTRSVERLWGDGVSKKKAGRRQGCGVSVIVAEVRWYDKDTRPDFA